VRRNPHRDELLRARTRERDDAVELEPVSGQDSHMIARAATADALVLVSRGDGEVPAGARVEYLRLS
jgi:molybdopterin biosynthesis enzyme